MKVLKFQHAGEWYKVKENGDMLQVNNTYNEWDDKWRFLGVSKHHWSNHIDVFLVDAFANPKQLIGGLVWDIDHGTTRLWGGRYYGKLPRIQSAYVEEVETSA